MLAAALLGLLAAPACFRRPVRDYACPAPDATASSTSPAVWDCNRAIVRRILRGRSFSLREYQAAAAYFEGLTGVPAGSKHTRQGEVPDPDALREAAARWDAWYAERRRD